MLQKCVICGCDVEDGLVIKYIGHGLAVPDELHICVDCPVPLDWVISD